MAIHEVSIQLGAGETVSDTIHVRGIWTGCEIRLEDNTPPVTLGLQVALNPTTQSERFTLTAISSDGYYIPAQASTLPDGSPGSSEILLTLAAPWRWVARDAGSGLGVGTVRIFMEIEQ